MIEALARRLSTRLAALAGWRLFAIALVLGAVAASALPPVHFLPGVFAFAGLAWLLRSAGSLWKAFALGWAFAFGYHVAGLYWIANAMLVDSARHAWAVPLAAAGLPAILAIFGGFATLAVWSVRPWMVGRPASEALLLAGVWSIAEWLRGTLFTGFPWNLSAYVWTQSEPMMQVAAFVGAYGLSFLTLVLAVAPSALGRPGLSGRRLVLACLVGTVSIWGFGSWRLASNPTETVDGVVLRLVQPNIAQRDKWRPEMRRAHLDRYLEMSLQVKADTRSAGLSTNVRPTHVIWPETAVPYFLGEDENLTRLIATAAPPGGAIVTGAPRVERAAEPRVYNSLFAITREGGVVSRYDKVHLVPFGEYMPLRNWIEIAPIVQSFQDFTPGPGLVSLAVPGLPAISPLICYEIIFPGAVIPADQPRPAMLLNLTNDAWYGHSSGPYQHFAISRMRAIEEGVALVRAANTGISGVVDPMGRITAKLDLGARGVIDAELPSPLASPTVFSSVGNWAFLALIFAAGIIGAIPTILTAISKAVRSRER